jgi:dihydroorotase-like cyclic amidohydrolase
VDGKFERRRNGEESGEEMTGSAAAEVEQRIDALLKGAIDPHVHSGPSIALRGLDHVELLQQASEAGFAAVVTKDHDYSGVMTAALIRKHFPALKTKIYSSIVLNNVVGGFNPYAVEHTAALGGKIVWLPTLAAANHLRWQASAKWVHPASTEKMRPVTAIPVLNDDKSVRDDLKEVLDIVAGNDMVLASGHLHVSETWLVFEEAQRRGVKRLVLTHPEDIVDASLNDVKGIAAMGAFVEHSLCMFLEGCKFKSRESEDLRQQIDAAGVEQTMLCSDLGQTGTFSPLEGFRRGIKLCMDLGYDDEQIRKMVSTNTARALGIEADVAAARDG